MPTAEMAPSAPSLSAPPSAKAALRSRMRALRTGLDGAAAGRAIGRRMIDAGLLPDAAAVSLFWPLADEIDLRPLMAALDAAGHPLALPAVRGPGRPLAFRRWRPGDALVPRGRWAIPEPADDAPEIRPDVVIAPLLAFDRRGVRLGYGAGHYDVTLAALAAAGPVTAVGVAFAAQEVDGLPADPWDVPLDAVVTERETIRIRAGTA